ncbi:MAG: hypothetical protein HY512_03290 [Candidatus Aenigmarchaeota archaeon]|nr:hypothetical protein [Candidatus Aenigmarchaeota archaeon]
MSQTPSKPETLRISPRIEHRDISIILGTGAENLDKLGFRVGKPIKLDVAYSVMGRIYEGKVEIYEAEVGGVPVYLLSRHGSEGIYTPAYKVDLDSNVLALVDDKQGAGSKVILASSLVGGCRTTDWEIGDMVLVEDGSDMHADDFYVDGNEPYVHAHGLFNRDVSRVLLEKAGERQIPVQKGGIYYSGPDTTGNRFETPAEMARLLAPAYLRRYLDALADVVMLNADRALGPVDPSNHLRPYPTKEEIALQELRNIIDNMSTLEPNLVGMTLIREAGRVRTFSTRNSGYKQETGDKNKHLAKFGGFAMISDFPESEETAHGTNSEVALGKLPVIMEIFAEAIPTIQKEISEGSSKY